VSTAWMIYRNLSRKDHLQVKTSVQTSSVHYLMNNLSFLCYKMLFPHISNEHINILFAELSSDDEFNASFRQIELQGSIIYIFNIHILDHKINY
jgi:hypothetical protein